MTHHSHALNTETPASPGLDGIIVATTRLSEVRGKEGHLILAGRAIEDLAGFVSFEEGVRHLWKETALPAGPTLFRDLAAARQAAWTAIPAMAALRSRSPILLLQTGLAGIQVPDVLHPAIAMTAAFPVLVAAAARLAEGQQPIPPDPGLGSAHDFLRMLDGTTPPMWKVEALNRYLVTIIDHGLNASTFAARVIASTQAGFQDAVIGGLAALKGPLHGGAPGPVLDMLDAIGTSGHPKQWIEAELAAGHRLMGFGHRIYRARDPRADVLKEGVRRLPKTERLALAEVVETAALAALRNRKPDRPLETNVEFYTAILLDGIGLERTLFTPVFAMGRVAGWCAHAAEQQAEGKLIRPKSLYAGPSPCGNDRNGTRASGMTGNESIS
ncbi:citrate synthase/methylcitrate synthase [Roseibium aquae]|uniref:citrate synthase (unknown stereospecificity) n=1 Tax=Roseibium aquae TaxID=1323746 RepID=A0A916WZ51_9HYPH|nr:citrate synthase [Roseibium aquae]GGB40891.1 citrate synthase/methylcitrate synthase [Roseibium aquae]